MWSIVLAAGSGSRFGGTTPKQYEQLGDRRVLDWSIDAARSVSDRVVLVVAAEYADAAEPSVDAVVVGGSERSDSVRAGLAAVPEDADVIVVHDAARPLATSALFMAVVAAVRDGADGAIPGVLPTDTIKRVNGDLVVETLERGQVRAVQTPQAFNAGVLRRAHAKGANATDDAALVELIKGEVIVVVGDSRNLKITHEADLRLAERLLA